MISRWNGDDDDVADDDGTDGDGADGDDDDDVDGRQWKLGVISTDHDEAGVTRSALCSGVQCSVMECST